jgi:hypothetical protein
VTVLLVAGALIFWAAVCFIMQRVRSSWRDERDERDEDLAERTDLLNRAHFGPDEGAQ